MFEVFGAAPLPLLDFFHNLVHFLYGSPSQFALGSVHNKTLDTISIWLDLPSHYKILLRLVKIAIFAVQFYLVKRIF